MSRTHHCFVPPYLLQHLALSDPEEAQRWHRLLAIDEDLRLQRAARTPDVRRGAAAAGGPAWVVHTADGGTDLPGRVARRAGDPPSDDVAVEEAALGISGSLALFAEVYGRDSYDGAGATVSATVHFGQGYDNAFWDGTQLVFGDGDGRVFDRFTKPVDVLAHELTHAVTEHTAGFVYQGQSGALNESMSDVFASCLKQRLLGQTALAADWLIGEGLFLPGIEARGLRDLAAPGTAYDDPALGKDPQPGHLDDYVDTTDDNGGVHLNSGIPNRAFHLAALSLGGSSWEGAGRVWWAALTGDQVTSRSNFADFAAATIAAAADLGDIDVSAVEDAWAGVGVAPRESAAAPGPPATPAPPADADRVAVRRTGGFAGRTTEARVDLGADPRAPELRDRVGRIDLRRVAGSAPQPDRFVYEFDLCGDRATVCEQDLTDDLRRVADLVLPLVSPR